MVFLKLFLYTRSLVASQAQPNSPPPPFLSSFFMLPIYFTYVDYFFPPSLSSLLKYKTCGGDGSPVRSKEHLIIFPFSLLSFMLPLLLFSKRCHFQHVCPPADGFTSAKHRQTCWCFSVEKQPFRLSLEFHPAFPSPHPNPFHLHTKPRSQKKRPPVPLSESPPSPLFPALFPPIIISGVSDGIRCCLLIASCGTLLQHPHPDTHTQTQTQTRTPQKMFVCCRNQSVKTNIK